MGRLEGKVAIVTGGASGIGEETCRLFAREEARGVVVADIDGDAAARIAADLGPGRGLALRLDVSLEESWRSGVDDVLRHFGTVDVLVNNAGRGGAPARPVVEETTVEGWDLTFATNAKGVMLGMKHVIPAMKRAGGGSIINIASVYSIIGDDFGTAYAASKGAVRSLTRTAAVQYAASGIRINSVFPGFVETPMTRELHGRPGVREKRTRRTLLGRLATPRDIAWGILFLACEESAYMTGAELVIDGGVTAH
jgi:3alpha(or 20beta)-hydroxysteroid dehydrogenase